MLTLQVRICQRAYKIMVEEVGFNPEDVVFDPNILTVGTGMQEHNNYGVDFIRATKIIKHVCPGCKISGGVSNVAFSFRGNEAVRRAFHSAFLHHACRAGMDMGIVNAAQVNPPLHLPDHHPYKSQSQRILWTRFEQSAGTVESTPCSALWVLQVKADVYEKIDKELLEMVEDVLLNRCDNATERMLEYAATLDPKSKPTAVRKKGQVSRSRPPSPNNNVKYSAMT